MSRKLEYGKNNMANKTDIEIAFDALKAKVVEYTTLFNYFSGNQPLKYSTERLKRAFGNSSVYFAQNWLGVIVNAVLDRLVLKGYNAKDESVNNTLDILFKELNLQLDSYDVHEAALITGEAFIIVEQEGEDLEIYYNDPRQVVMFYDPNRPKIKLFAAKEWYDGNKYYINLYYPDRTEYYVSNKDSNGKTFILEETTVNPFSEIPVFHFRNSRRTIKRELGPAEISIQDAVNKLFSDLMVAAEFEAFKMRVFISQVDPGDIRVSPDMHMWMPARESEGQDAQVIEIGGSTLDNFLKPINDLASTLAITTRTPKNYLFDTGANLSGEALLVAEAPLVKKVKQYQENYSITWQELATFILKVKNIIINPSELVTVWEGIESNQPKTEAEIIASQVSSGIPLTVALSHAGWSLDEINQITGVTQ